MFTFLNRAAFVTVLIISLDPGFTLSCNHNSGRSMASTDAKYHTTLRLKIPSNSKEKSQNGDGNSLPLDPPAQPPLILCFFLIQHSDYYVE